MHTQTSIHLSRDARVEAAIRVDSDCQPYIVLHVLDADPSYVPSLIIFPAGPEFLDKLANECERAVREFIGDVPPASEFHDGPEVA